MIMWDPQLAHPLIFVEPLPLKKKQQLWFLYYRFSFKQSALQGPPSCHGQDLCVNPSNRGSARQLEAMIHQASSLR